MKIVKLVKMNGKSFVNLTSAEVVSMIDAHLYGDNEWFSEQALNEFCLVPNTNPRLEELRRKFLEIDNDFMEPVVGGTGSVRGRAQLRVLSENLRDLS